jgi:iron only hydrogenase large subunit-like protein
MTFTTAQCAPFDNKFAAPNFAGGMLCPESCINGPTNAGYADYYCTTS